MTLDFLSPELGDNTFLLFKWLGVCYLVTAGGHSKQVTCPNGFLPWQQLSGQMQVVSVLPAPPPPSPFTVADTAGPIRFSLAGILAPDLRVPGWGGIPTPTGQLPGEKTHKPLFGSLVFPWFQPFLKLACPYVWIS